MATMNVLSLVLLIALIGIHSTLTEALVNSVAVAGSEVNLKCQSISGNCRDVTWKKRTTQNAITIFRGNIGILNDYRDRYNVNNSSGCDLHIRNVNLMDAGKFVCDDLSADRSTITKSALLIILESSPKCAVKVNVTDGPAAEGDGVQLTCEMKFNGTDKASMTWKGLQNVPDSVQTDNKDVKLSHSVVAHRREIPSYECITTIELRRDIEDLATNIPTVPPCKTDPIELLYSVKTVTLTPSLAVFSPGTSIICFSDGNPSPSYKWQIADAVDDGKDDDDNWKDIPGDTQEEFITANASTNHYRCVASNTVRGSSFAAFSQSFQVNYTGNTEPKSASVVGIAVGVMAGVVALLIIVVIVCIRLRICNKDRSSKSEKDKFSKADQMPLKQTPNTSFDGSNNPLTVPVASVRPQPRGDTIKRPTVPPPELIPRKDGPEKKRPQQEDLVYASLASEQEPHRYHPKQVDVPNSEYASITLA